MADDLKKVGLVFKADGTADFAKSLKTINSLTQENYSSFKLAKSQWDSSTKSMDKLRDTQRYLSSQTDAYTAKVDTLKEELKNLENAENRNEKAISDKKNALNNAQATLNNYKKGLDEVNGKLKSGSAQIEEYAKKIENFGSKTKEVGGSLSKNITAPIAAAGTAAYAAWMSVDEAYDNIAVGTGATGDALSKLQESFDNVFAKAPFDAMDISNSLADLNTRFGFTGKVLEDASEKFLRFASVNKTDVSNAVALVSRAMGDAGIPAEEYTSVLDALTTASQASGISIDALTGNITKYGAPMRALGYTTEESIAIFASWEKAGVNTEIAFSGMKKAISNFSAEGKDAKVEFKKTLEEIAKCPDIASATTKAIEVFGTKAGPDLADAIKGGRFEFEEMLKLVESSSGQLDASFEATMDPADKAKVALNNLTLAGAALGDVIQSALGPVFESLADILKDFTEWFKNLNPEIRQTIVFVGGIIAELDRFLF
ncbi:MAG: phage tail tape measure protein [Thomasclavelia ramosa]